MSSDLSGEHKLRIVLESIIRQVPKSEQCNKYGISEEEFQSWHDHLISNGGKIFDADFGDSMTQVKKVRRMGGMAKLVLSLSLLSNLAVLLVWGIYTYIYPGDESLLFLEGTRQVRAKGRYFPELVEVRAIEFLDRNKDRLFLLYLALNTPHYPEQPLEKHLKLFEKLDEPLRTYAAFMSTTDDTVGRVVGKLQALDLRRRTIIIFMSDNGHQSYQSYDFFQVKVDGHASGFPKGHRFSSGDGPNDGGGNTGKWAGHKGTFLEGCIRVPAIISYPAKLPSGKVRKQAVTAMDWYPTLLELCGIKPPAAKLDGRSLLGVIRDGTAPSPHPALYFQWQNKWAMREGDWKLIRHKGPRETAKERFTLHNLADEQPEVRDYAKEKPEKVRHLLEMHLRWQKDVFSK